MPTMWLSDSQKVGVAFCTGGFLFLTFGVFLFFDRALLAMGNILMLIGIVALIGPQKSLLFFVDRKKIRGTAAFAAGILLILFRWPLVGFLIEGYGIVVLFGDVIGTVASFLRNVPVVGPYIGMAVDRIPGIRGGEVLPV